jgi:hypothetical protein
MFIRHLTLLAGLLGAAASPAIAQPAVGFQPFDERIQSQFRFNSNIVEPRYEAIRTERAWREIWDRATTGSAPPRPQIDFEREMLLLAAMGSRSSGGYTIRIVSVRETRHALVVSVVRNLLGPRCGAIAAVTEPADIVRVRATAKRLRWVFRDVRRPCS